MTIAIIVLLLAIGIALVFAEILVIPGTSIAGFLGFLFYIIGILFTYDNFGRTSGHITLITTLVFSYLFIYLSLKNGYWKKFQTEHQMDGSANDLDIGDIEIGDIGETLTELNPSGNALIHGEIFEVTTKGESIASGSEITVTAIDDNVVVVSKVS